MKLYDCEQSEGGPLHGSGDDTKEETFVKENKFQGFKFD